MKKAVSLLLAFIFTVSALNGIAAADGGKPALISTKSYSDIDSSAWYADFVSECIERGWIEGYADGTFKPDQSMTRAEFVTALFRLIGNDGRYPDLVNYHWRYFYEWPFNDVAEDSPYTEAVLWAKLERIVNGTGNNRFSPDSALTCEQAAAIFYRSTAKKLYSRMDGLKEFSDASKISPWAKDAVKWMQGLDMLVGDEKGNLNPRKALTRAECAKLISRLNAALNNEGGSSSVRNLTAGYKENVDEKDLAETEREDREALLRFCAEIARENLGSEKSDIISPVSILYALGMLTSGAKGETLAQLEKVIGVPTDVLNAYLYSFGKGLYGRPEQVQLADSIWINEENEFDCKREYLQTLADYYGAEAFSGKFDSELCEELNRWVYEKTFGMIPKTLEEIDPEAAMYLVNTLALQLPWSDDYGRSIDETFTNSAGKKEDAKMLYGTEEQYLRDGNTTGFIKSYKYGYKFAALLPDEGVSMDEYLKSLTGEKISKLLSSTKDDCRVHTKMPEFKTDSFFKLVEPLKKMGVTDVFIPFVSDLGGIADPDLADLYVSDIFQKAHIELDKDGTKAAAVTVIEILIATALAPEEKEEYYVYLDRPFVYMILDPSGELPLFIGVVNSVA